MNRSQLLDSNLETRVDRKTSVETRPESRSEPLKKRARDVLERLSKIKSVMKNYMIAASLALTLSSCGSTWLSTGLCELDRSHIGSRAVDVLNSGMMENGKDAIVTEASRTAFPYFGEFDTPVFGAKFKNVIAFQLKDGRWEIDQRDYVKATVMIQPCPMGERGVDEYYPMLRFKNPSGGLPTTSVPVDSPAGRAVSEFARIKETQIGKPLRDTILADHLEIGVLFKGDVAVGDYRTEYRDVAFLKLADARDLRRDGIYETSGVVTVVSYGLYRKSEFDYRKIKVVTRDLRCCGIILGRNDWFAFGIERGDDEELDRRLGYPRDRGIDSLVKRYNHVIPGFMIDLYMIGAIME